jgi:plastocyanin
MKMCKFALLGFLGLSAMFWRPTQTEAATTSIVQVTSFLFTPSILTITPGDTVHWTNGSTSTHDVTQGTRTGGVTPSPYWAKLNLAAFTGRSSVTFSNVGSYPYICEQHVVTDPRPPSNPSQTGLVTVASANLPPTVAIDAPASGTQFTAPATFVISATASDSDGTVTNVQFFSGTTLLGSDSAAPFSVTANNRPAGIHLLTAVARDSSGGMATSAVVTVVVNTSHTVAALASSFSPSSLTVTVGDTVNFTGLSAGGHSVTGNSPAEPFCGAEFPSTCTVTFNTLGAFGYHCIPHQLFGMTGTITVSGPNLPPVVSISSPANGAVVASPFNLSANGSDLGGSVTSVQFFNGAASLGTDTSRPFSIPVSSLAPGSYSLVARAVDNTGLMSTSAPVNITVVTPVDIQLLSPSAGTDGFKFNFTANPGLRYVVEGSANVTSPSPFVPLATNVANASVMTFTDPASNRSNRAYRVFRQQE